MSYVYLPERVVKSWPELSPAAKAVAVAIASFMNGEATGCFPGVKSISKVAGYKNGRTTQRAIGELISAGVLTVVRRPGQSNLYSWGVSAPPPVPQTTPSDDHPRKISTKTPRTTDHPKDTNKDTNKNLPSGDGAATRKRSKKNSKKSNPRPNGGNVWRWWHGANTSAGRKLIKTSADTAAAKRLAGMVHEGDFDENQLRECMVAFLADVDPFLLKNGHALRLLPIKLNAYLNKPPPPRNPESERLEAEFEKASLSYRDSGIEEQITAQGQESTDTSNHDLLPNDSFKGDQT